MWRRPSIQRFMACSLLLGSMVFWSMAQDPLIFRDDFESGDKGRWSPPMATQSMITITMDAETVSALLAGGFSLFGFKAVGSSDLAGRPLIWFSRQGYSLQTVVAWGTGLAGYSSSSAIANGQRIDVGALRGLGLGQIWQIDSTGTGAVLNGGPVLSVSIQSMATQRFTVGVAEEVGGETRPYCAFPLFPGFLDSFEPRERILLAFATANVPAGTVVEGSLSTLNTVHARALEKSAVSPGLLVEMDATMGRNVTFDVIDGWQWGNFSWARTVPSNENIVPLLIDADG